MNYWEKRQQQLNSQMEKDEAKLKKRLSSFYDTEYNKLEKQIASYYSLYGENKVIEYRNLMQNLPDADKRQLIERMQDFAQKYPEYADLLPVRESIYKLNRLEGLQMSVRMQQLEIGAVNNEQIEKHLNRQAMRGANAAAETLCFGKNFYAGNPDIVKRFVNVPWANGKNFSKRIWDNTEKLSNYLNTDIAQGLARGDSYEKLARGLRQRFKNVSRNDAYRLIYTEGTYVMAEATMQPFLEDFEKYRVSTVGDGKVCPICRAASEPVYDIRDRQPGVNYPPLHTWCRCTFIIVVDDWDKWVDDYEKRYGNGKGRKVANRLNPDIMKEKRKDSGPKISGALNPDSKKADDHAKRYYGLVRAMKTDTDKIAKNTGLPKDDIDLIKKYLFMDPHNLNGEQRRFDPDYMIAESWRRLIDGRDIKKHDLTLLKHEIEEQKLVKGGMSQEKAHKIVSKKYNYRKEADEYYGSLKKHKKK